MYYISHEYLPYTVQYADFIHLPGYFLPHALSCKEEKLLSKHVDFASTEITCTFIVTSLNDQQQQQQRYQFWIHLQYFKQWAIANIFLCEIFTKVVLWNILSDILALSPWCLTGLTDTNE